MTHNNSLSNGSDSVDKSSLPDVAVIVNCVLNVPLMLVSIIRNSLVLATILSTSSLRSSHTIVYLSSLAVSDLLVASVVQPLFVVSGLAQDNALGKVWLKVGFVCCGVSLCTITAITLDRFLVLHYHIKYVVYMTTSRVRKILIAMWIYSILLPFIYTWSPKIYNQIVAITL